MAEDNQWLTEKHYLVCPKGVMFKQMKVSSQEHVTFGGHLAATTADTMKGSVFICLGSTAFAMGAVAGLACLLIPGPGWVMAAIIGAALLLAVGIGYLKCKVASASRFWINDSPNLVIHGNNGLVVGQSKLNCPDQGAQVDIKETFWEAMLSTTMNNVGHIANFAFGFLAGRGGGSLLRTGLQQGWKVAGAEFLNVVKSEMGNMFNPATLTGKMSWFCRSMRGFGMYGAYKGQIDIWTDKDKSTTDKILASGAELILAIFAAKGATTVCFPAGTMVHTSNGLRPIEQLQAGDKVWTVNELTGEREMKPILNTHRRATLQMMVVELENGTIFEVTPEHRFLTVDGWREIREIVIAEELELIDGLKIRIKEIGIVPKTAAVFNFDVQDNENYFVTEDGVLVHNGYAKKLDDGSYEIGVNYKSDWNAEQISEANMKIEALNESGELIVSAPNRGTKSAADMYREAGFEIPKGKDIDHIKDLQFGGIDDVKNMRPLDQSVNRSLGPRIYHQTKNLPVGTKVSRIVITYQ